MLSSLKEIMRCAEIMSLSRDKSMYTVYVARWSLRVLYLRAASTFGGEEKWTENPALVLVPDSE